MCQLLGMSSRSPASLSGDFEAFRQRGGQVGDHIDGWGVAFHSGQDCDVIRSIKPAAHCHQAEALVRQSRTAPYVIAHIRKATIGAITPCNTHPFTRRLAHQTWAFAHNGDLPQLPDVAGPYQPAGATDSEKAFCHVLSHLADSGMTPAAALQDDVSAWQALTRIVGWLAGHGSFNFLLSNGDWLLAHCSTTLHWQQRPQEQVVIASQPLSGGDAAWQAMMPGELLLFRHGQLTKKGLTTAAAVRP